MPSATVVANPTTLVVGEIFPSNIPNGAEPTGTGGAIGTITGSAGEGSASKSAAGKGLYGTATGLYFGLSTCMCVLIGAWLSL